MPGSRTRTLPACRIRKARAGDGEFILSLASRFVAFELPKTRRKAATLAAIRVDIARALDSAPKGERFFVAERNDDALGFVHLQVLRDFFTGAPTCHISDLAVAPGHDGQGIGRALLRHSQQWARKQGCGLLTLAVFPGNERARALYRRAGFHDELIRMAKPLRLRD